MNKKAEKILCIVSVIVVLATAFYYIVKYKAKICAFLDKLNKKKEKEPFTDEEYRDFADI